MCREGEVSNEEVWEGLEIKRKVITKEGGSMAMREKKEDWEVQGSTTPTFTHIPVTFDAVVVKCFCHGGQGLLPHVTIGDQLEESDSE